jgi:hypothetical protein
MPNYFDASLSTVLFYFMQVQAGNRPTVLFAGCLQYRQPISLKIITVGAAAALGLLSLLVIAICCCVKRKKSTVNDETYNPSYVIPME